MHHAEGHRGHGAHSRATGDAEQIRFCQRIAQRALECAATTGEAGADERGEQHAWCPQVTHDGDRGRITETTERIDDITRGDRHGADGESEHHHKHQQ